MMTVWGQRQRWPIAACVAYRAALGIIVGTPLAIGFGAVTGGHPRSDAVLWERGGYWLVEAARVLRDELGAHAGAGGVMLIALSIGWLLPLGAVIASMDTRSKETLTRQAVSSAGGLVLLYGATLVTQVIAIGVMVWLGSRFAGVDRDGDLLRAGTLGFGLLLAAMIAIGHDIARVLWVQRRPRAWELVNRTLELFRRQPGALWIGAAWRALAVWTIWIAAFLATTRLYGGGEAMWMLALCVQAAAITGYVALRASWFAELTSRASRSFPELYRHPGSSPPAHHHPPRRTRT